MALISISSGVFAFDGDTTQPSQVQVGVSNVPYGPHTSGYAGIAVNSTGITNFVDFIGLTAYTTKSTSNTQEVNQLGSSTSHDSLGVFAFAQVGDNDIWFGEWSAEGTSDSTRTVYYSGLNEDTSTAGSPTTDVTYTVYGINSYDSASGGNILSGEFTAKNSFTTLEGSLTNGSLTVDIGEASIGANAVISGSDAEAFVSGSPLPVAISGSVSGRFFNSFDDLAGVVDFSGTQYDTAFGGSAQ